MIRFIQHFAMYWREYDSFLYYWSERKEQLEKLIDAGEYWYKSRFDYAWKNAVLWWKHRDQYSKKCHGDCENCKAKNC